VYRIIGERPACGDQQATGQATRHNNVRREDGVKHTLTALVMVVLQVGSKFLVAHFVPRLELAVRSTLLLHGIVGQVDQPVFQRLESKLLARGANVPVVVQETTQTAPFRRGDEQDLHNGGMASPSASFGNEPFLRT